jgi:K+-sensing histidine kinase KdpD
MIEAALSSDPISRETVSGAIGFRVVDSPREQALDEFVALAAKLCDSRASFIALLDQEHLSLKACFGLQSSMLGPILPLLVRTLDQNAIDIRSTPDEPEMKFCASIPLLSNHGECLGILSVVDDKVRDLNGEQRISLGTIARLVAHFIEKNGAWQQESDRIKILESEKHTRERFIVNLCHDLRTPLTTISTAGQLILKRVEKVNPEFIQAAGSLLRAVTRADRMLTDLLDANKIHSGQMIPLRFEEFDLAQMIGPVLEDLRNTYGNRFKLVCGPDNSVFLGIWDPCALRRVIENLIANAIKYGDPQQVVTVTLVKEAAQVKLSVHNHGKVMRRVETESILSGKCRAGPLTQSWGLGLLIVQDVIKGHGGVMQLESEPGAGTLFTAILPTGGRGPRGEGHGEG